ncbi:MAG: PAS domain-containing protein, partial [Bacteroidota bacterium]
MVFKSFYIKVIARILFLAIGLFLLNYCLVRGLYLRSVYIAVFTLALTVELMVFINKFNRKLNAFLTSTLQQDFTLHFKEHQQERSFKEFYRLLNRITALFKKIREEKEIKQRFLETLIEHVTIGLASFDQEGNVQFVNSAFLRITGHLRLTHIRQLQFDNRQLADAMTGVAPNGITMVKWHKHNQLLNLAVYATVFKVDSKEFKLISLQNITHELNAHEMEAWQKLIRVLTHEIMNSISPIISLSGTLHNLLHKKNRENGLTGANDWTALVAGVGAIKTRSEGLHYFTQKYRELTHIP